jgi:hypothetical protein
MSDLHQLVDAAGLVNLLDHGSGGLVYSEGCAGVTQQDLERLVALMRVRVAELEAVHEDASGAILQAVEAERERWEEAMRKTWRMVDILRPPGAPGSYARGEHNGIVSALTTMRENVKASAP